MAATGEIADLIRCAFSSARVSPLHYSGYMSREQVLDLYFMEARARLIDIAAFMDRVERASGEADFRFAAFQVALQQLASTNAERAKNVLLALSDTTTDPIPAATTKAACGAPPKQ